LEILRVARNVVKPWTRGRREESADRDKNVEKLLSEDDDDKFFVDLQTELQNKQLANQVNVKKR